METLVEIKDLEKRFRPGREFFALRKAKHWVHAVDGVSFSIAKGQTFGLVGESGCGKTTMAKLLLRIEHPTSGEIRFSGQNIHELKGDALREYRKSVQVVFQDPFSSLNPRMKVRELIEEPLIATGTNSIPARNRRVAELVDLMGLLAGAERLYPHQFSGGQRQRIAIARAIATNPSFLVLDEPVASVDVSIRAQLMNLLKDLQEKFGLTYLLISHDLAGVRYLSDVTGVMYLGKLVELGPAPEVYGDTLHPYTEALLSNAMPSHPRQARTEIILSGEIPSPLNVPPGCRFHPRCPKVMPQCSTAVPEWREVKPGHWAACHLHDGIGGPGSNGAARTARAVAKPATPA